jgi:flagellar FliL protein
MDVQLMLSSEESLDEVKLHAPALVNEMLLLVSDQDGAELKTAKGKEAFRQSALKACNKLLNDLTGNEPVKDLFFTAFFVQ